MLFVPGAKMPLSQHPVPGDPPPSTNRLLACVLIWTLSVYPVTAICCALLPIEDSFLSILMLAPTPVLSSLVLWRHLRERPSGRPRIHAIAGIVFLALFAASVIIHDLTTWPADLSITKFYGILFGTVILPYLAFSLSAAPAVAFRDVSKFVSAISLLCLLVVWTSYFCDLPGSARIYDSPTDQGRLKTQYLNPISVGLTACVLWVFTAHEYVSSYPSSAFLRLSIASIAALSMAASGSKGVFLAALSFVAYQLLQFRQQGRRLSAFLGFLGVSAVAFAAFPLLGGLGGPNVSLPLGCHSGVLGRMGALPSDPSTHLRIDLLVEAWQQFSSHPLLGHGLLAVDASYWYPHNIFLEALSATGLAGAGLLVMTMRPVVQRLCRSVSGREPATCLHAIYLPVSITMAIYGSIFAASFFFALTAILHHDGSRDTPCAA